MKLNFKGFMESVSSLEAYEPLKSMSPGVNYLYNALYVPISKGMTVRICDIDYDAFAVGDVGDLELFYDKISCRDIQTVNSMASTLNSLPAALSKTGYI